MECLPLVLRFLMTGRLERIVVYFFQFMSQFEAGRRGKGCVRDLE